MEDKQIDDRLTELRRYKHTVEELKEKMEAIESEIKAEMESRGVEQLLTKHYKVTWKAVSSTRLDTRALKEERPEIYARYAVTAESRRFMVT